MLLLFIRKHILLQLPNTLHYSDYFENKKLVSLSTAKLYLAEMRTLKFHLVLQETFKISEKAQEPIFANLR